MLFNVDAHCDDGRRYIVRTDELLTAFLELEATLLKSSLKRFAANEVKCRCTSAKEAVL
ncbi:MAG: hypothetical protein WA183_13550 [Chthoniobacterales bacterium]